MRPRISQILKFGKHKTPGYGINRGFYLSVLAAQAPLPCLPEIVTPKGENGTVKGFGVPLSKDATKNCLNEALARGAYAVASEDQKTVIKLLIMSKEEAGFSPPATIESAKSFHLTSEVKERMLSTWSIAQLTFESHHPMVFPAVRLILELADRIASLTGGLVADPLSRSYRMPGEVPTAFTTDGSLDVRDVVSVKTVEGEEGPWAFTMGMHKFNLHEYEIQGFSPVLMPIVTDLLYAVGQQRLSGEVLQGGDTIGSESAAMCLEAGAGPCLPAGVPCYRITPSHTSLDEALTAWAAEAADEQATGV